MYLRYYAGNRFPLDQGAGGPFVSYPGTPALATGGPFPVGAWHAVPLQHHRPCSPCGRRRSLSGMRGLGDIQSFLAAGTSLAYNVTWGTGLHFTSASAIAAKIKPILSSRWGIEIDSEADNPSSLMNQPQGFALRVHTTRDYGTANDVKTIIDGEIVAAGRNPASSGISVVSTPTVDAATQSAIENVARQISDAQAAGDTATVAALSAQMAALKGNIANPPFDLTTFLSNNWPWLVAGGAAALILPRVL